MPADDLLTREEVLGGLPARRAHALLYVIESHTARLMARSREATEWFLTEDARRERDLAFLEAFALGGEPPLRPTVQGVEGYATGWAHLVPDNPQLRAGLDYPGGEQTFEAAVREIATFSSLRRVVLQLPAGPARELKVWTHRITLDGDSEPLPAQLELSCGQETRRLELAACQGQILVPLASDACRLQITLADRAAD